MDAYFKVMHGATARIIRLFAGLWVVIYAAQQPAAFAFPVALIGTGIAITGIADICVIELIVHAARRSRSGSEQRAA